MGKRFGAGRRAKFAAKPTVVDGVRFASKKEAKRYVELRLLERAGRIAGLELQPVYVLMVNGVKVCSYVADFRYREGGSLVVEDVKGFRTREYKLKKKLLLATHGIAILET